MAVLTEHMKRLTQYTYSSKVDICISESNQLSELIASWVECRHQIQRTPVQTLQVQAPSLRYSVSFEQVSDRHLME